MHNDSEQVLLGWVDPGQVDSQFASGVMSVLLHKQYTGEGPFFNINHNIGTQIHTQRQGVINVWKQSGIDWLLWVDSDIVITPQLFLKLWEVADKKDRPVVSGIYFISFERIGSLPSIVPCVFKEDENGEIRPLHPLPDNEVVQIRHAGMGFLLMHKSILEKLEKFYPDEKYFDVEAPTKENPFGKGEDVAFFEKLNGAGIPIFAHTGAIANHAKKFIFDEHYYHLWWDTFGHLYSNQPQGQQTIIDDLTK